MNLLLIFIGGGLGSVCRYALMNNVNRAGGFPWGTLAVNMLGALVIGILLELLALRFTASTSMKLLLVTGFLGGFTTFSTFSLESALMFERHDYMSLALYIALSVVGTIAAVFLGSGIVRAVS